MTINQNTRDSIIEHLEIGMPLHSAADLVKFPLEQIEREVQEEPENRPAAFAGVLPFPHPIRPGWREHRLVCLRDFQGVGIGIALSESIASPRL